VVDVRIWPIWLSVWPSASFYASLILLAPHLAAPLAQTPERSRETLGPDRSALGGPASDPGAMRFPFPAILMHCLSDFTRFKRNERHQRKKNTEAVRVLVPVNTDEII